MKIILTLLCMLAVAQQKQDDRGYIVKVGDKAPDFTITYLDGSSKKLSDLRGKIVMIQFTASWCGVCRKEMPHIEKDIWLKYKDRNDFALVGVDYKESKEKAAKFAKDIKVSYPLTLDKDGKIFHLYADQGAGVTRNIIVDKEGNIAFLTRLYDEKEFSEMKKIIAELLNQ